MIVLEYELEAKDILPDAPPNDVALVLVVSQEFPDDVFHAIHKQASNAPIVWLCQDRNKKELLDASVEKCICDGTDEWVVFNDVLEKYLKSFHKKS